MFNKESILHGSFASFAVALFHLLKLSPIDVASVCVCVSGTIMKYCCAHDNELKLVYWMCQFVSLCFYRPDRACNVNWHQEFMGSIVLLYHDLMY